MQSQRREKGKNEGRVERANGTKEKREGSFFTVEMGKGTEKEARNFNCYQETRRGQHMRSCVSESGRIYAQLLRFGGVFSSPPSSARKLAVRYRRDFRFTGGHRDPFMPAHADHSLYAPVGQVQASRDYVLL